MEQITQETDTTRFVRRSLYITRWIIIFTVLLETILAFKEAQFERKEIIAWTLAIAAITLFVMLTPRIWSAWRKPIIQILIDTILITILVYFSDGFQSPFFGLYFVPVIAAAVSYGMFGALVCAGVISVFSLWIEFIDAGSSIVEAFILEDILRILPHLFIVAVVTGALRDRIRDLADTAADMRADTAFLQREMELARAVQLAQLPRSIPKISGTRIAVWYKAAYQVSGDLYDFYPISKDYLGLVVADVAGKGVPAALLVSNVKFSIREHYSDDKIGMMEAVNKEMMGMTPSESFVTLIYGTLIPAKREFRYVNAGHMPPIIVKGATGETVCCTSPSPPLGVVESGNFTEEKIKLDVGDTLVLYTDGVTDALAWEGDGIEVLRKLLSELQLMDIEDWMDELSRRIEEPRRLDDVTLVAVRME